MKVDVGSAIFEVVGGATSVGMTINNEIVDITNADDDGVRTLLEGAGVRSVSLQFSGVYLDDDAAQSKLEQAASENTHATVQMVKPGSANGGIFQGEFAIASLEYSGEHNQKVVSTIKLESSGPVVFS